METKIKKFLKNYPWVTEEKINKKVIVGSRMPTTAEIAWGAGAIHYRDFPFAVCINPQGRRKKRIFAKDENLWYTI